MKKLFRMLKFNKKTYLLVLLATATLIFAIIAFTPTLNRDSSIKTSLNTSGELYYIENISDNFIEALFNPRYVIIYTNTNDITKISSVNLSRRFFIKWNVNEINYFEMYNPEISKDFQLEYAHKSSDLLKYHWKQGNISIDDIEKKNKSVIDYSKILDIRNFDYARKSELLNKGKKGQIPVYLDINNDKALKSIEIASGPGYADNDDLLKKILDASKKKPGSDNSLLDEKLLHQIADIVEFDQSLERIGYFDNSYYADDALTRYKKGRFYYRAAPSLSISFIQEIEEIGIVIFIQHNWHKQESEYTNKYLLVYKQDANGNYELTYYEATELYP